MGEVAGPFIKDKNSIKTTYAHQNCIMWCPEVYFCAKLERLKHVEDAIKRGKQLKCSHCGKKGAAVGCTLPSCNRTYHLKCAHACGARFNAEKFIVTCPIHKSAKKTPAPMWSKTMNGDEALNEATTNAMTAPTVAGENTGATPLLERLAKGAGPAPNASGRPVTRKATEFNFDEIDENERTELGFNRPKKGMSKLERTRGVIASVVAANERVNEGCVVEDDPWVHLRSSRHVAGPVRVRPGRNWHRSWPIRVDQRPPSFQSLIAPEGAAAEEDEVEAAADEDVRASACAARTEFLVARHPMPPARVRRPRVNT